MAFEAHSTSAFAEHLHSRKSQTGPVTAAIRAMRSDEQPRRNILKAAGAVLVGTILGTAPYKTGRDLTAVAEAFIDDAASLGMRLVIGPDGNVWRAMPIGVGEDYEARDAHWHKLNNRPPLLRAVHAAVQRGYRPA